MKRILFSALASWMLVMTSCESGESQGSASTTSETTVNGTGQSGVKDDISNPNIVQVASSNKDFSTLVTAVKAAELVDVMSNAGPFTVFAPTNDAFAKLPAGTVDDLLKAENKEKLADILQYHVFVGVLKLDALADGNSLEMVNGGKTSITVKDNQTYINGQKILATVNASNGIIHVLEGVMVPVAQ